MEKKARKRVKKVVSSIIKITKSPTTPAADPVVKEKVVADARSLSLQKYHTNVKGMSREIVKFAKGLSPDNLLSVKMALMEAVREVERVMRENKEG